MPALAAEESGATTTPGRYGRIWIELDEVKLSTTEEGNTIKITDVQLEVRAESKYRPPKAFAKHLE